MLINRGKIVGRLRSKNKIGAVLASLKIFVGDEDFAASMVDNAGGRRKQTARAIRFLKRERKEERKTRRTRLGWEKVGRWQEESADGNISTPRGRRILSATIADT